MFIPLNLSRDQFRKFIPDLPYGVMFSIPVRNQKGEIIDFECQLFNRHAEEELHALKLWHPGATLWGLFPEDAESGLFAVYKQVFESTVAHGSIYCSPVTKLLYRSKIQFANGGIVAIGKVYHMRKKAVAGSGEFTVRLAQYKASVYEAYSAYL